MYDNAVSRYFAVSSARSVMASSALSWRRGYGGNFDVKKHNKEVDRYNAEIADFLRTLPPTKYTKQ
jgi:hypothetical protein